MKIKHSRKTIILLAIYSCLLAASFIIGGHINLYEYPYFYDLDILDLALWALLSLAIFFVLYFLSAFLNKMHIKISENEPVNKKSWLLAAALLFLAWLPYFLMYYPGILTPDSLDSIRQALGLEALKNYHPATYTLFVKIILKIGLLFGDLNFAVACYSLLQMIIMAAIFGYAVYWLAKKAMPKYILALTLLFFALNPVIAMYSITMWKDIIFNGLMLLLFLFLADVAVSRGEALINRKGLIYFSSLGIGLAFTRNNGILVIITAVAVLLIFLKKHIKKLAPVFIALIIFILIIQGPVYSLLGIEKSPASEALGIPLQQIAYTARSGGVFTLEQEAFLNKIIPLETMKQVYVPYIVNEIKFNPEFDKYYLEENKLEFLKVWAGAMPVNFSSYLKAHLMQTLGYYHIGTSNWICRYGIIANELGLRNSDIIQKTVKIDMKKTVYNIIENLDKIPVISNVFSIASWVWLVFFCCIILSIKNRKELLLPLLPLISIWLSLMIGTPAFCEFRYMLSFHYCLPFIVMLLFVRNNKFVGENRANL